MTRFWIIHAVAIFVGGILTGLLLALTPSPELWVVTLIILFVGLVLLALNEEREAERRGR